MYSVDAQQLCKALEDILAHPLLKHDANKPHGPGTNKPGQKPHGKWARGMAGKQTLAAIIRAADLSLGVQGVPSREQILRMDDEGVWNEAVRLAGSEERLRGIIDRLPERGQGENLNVDDLDPDMLRAELKGAGAGKPPKPRLATQAAGEPEPEDVKLTELKPKKPRLTTQSGSTAYEPKPLRLPKVESVAPRLADLAPTRGTPRQIPEYLTGLPKTETAAPSSSDSDQGPPKQTILPLSELYNLPPIKPGHVRFYHATAVDGVSASKQLERVKREGLRASKGSQIKEIHVSTDRPFYPPSKDMGLIVFDLDQNDPRIKRTYGGLNQKSLDELNNRGSSELIGESYGAPEFTIASDIAPEEMYLFEGDDFNYKDFLFSKPGFAEYHYREELADLENRLETAIDEEWDDYDVREIKQQIKELEKERDAWRLKSKKKDADKTSGLTFTEGSAEDYHRGLTRIDEEFPGFVTVHDVDYYRSNPNVRVFTTEDGSVGYNLTDHGDGRIEVAGVFNYSGERGAGTQALLEAVAQGANYLEAYDGFLPFNYFDVLGAIPTERWAWDEQYRHPKWQESKFGTPGVMMMDIPRSEDRESESYDERRKKFLDAYEKVGGGEGVPEAILEKGKKRLQKNDPANAGFKNAREFAEYMLDNPQRHLPDAFS